MTPRQYRCGLGIDSDGDGNCSACSRIAREHGPIFPGEEWEHYKGGVYEIIAKALVESTHEPVVVYRTRGLTSGTVWVRPLREWMEPIQMFDDPDASLQIYPVRYEPIKTRTVPRFKFLRRPLP